jgi:hypothetical protein
MITLPQDLKRDIARVARSVDLEFLEQFVEAGTCAARCLTGQLLLTSLGLETRLVVGGMVYRAGPNTTRDVLAFCGPGNLGCIHNGMLLGHYWLSRGEGAVEEVIDFSCGDWRGAERG